MTQIDPPPPSDPQKNMKYPSAAHHLHLPETQGAAVAAERLPFLDSSKRGKLARNESGRRKGVQKDGGTTAHLIGLARAIREHIGRFV